MTRSNQIKEVYPQVYAKKQTKQETGVANQWPGPKHTKDQVREMQQADVDISNFLLLKNKYPVKPRYQEVSELGSQELLVKANAKG